MPDSAHQSCLTHCDCPQEHFCYKGKCIEDPKVAVYCCANPGCPPGHWCVDPAGKKDHCAESDSYVCQDACDCGPAHCCVPDSNGVGRCVKDEMDPWQPGPGLGSGPLGLICRRGIDATHCCASATCHDARAAYVGAGSPFLCWDRPSGSNRSRCGGNNCFGTACNCASGESCVDTVNQTAPGRTCGAFSGGSCVSNATAEALFGWKSSDLLPCCRKGCVPGTPCEAGWVTDAVHPFVRAVGTCGACANGTSWSCGKCGNGTCDAGEWPGTCSTDCICGDGVCSVGEQSCAADCGSCGNGKCEPAESPASCPDDCTFSGCGDGWCERVTESTASCAIDCPCPSSGYLPEEMAACGDGSCQSYGDCGGPETCITCPDDCGACEAKVVEGRAGEIWPFGYPRAVWSSNGIYFAAGYGGLILHHDGIAWRRMTSGTNQALSAVWGSGPNDVFAVGNGGTVLHFDGNAWSSMASTTSAGLYGVWGNSGSDVFAVGGGGTIVHYDGAAWSPMTSNTAVTLRGVWGSSSDAFAVGYSYDPGGVILHYDGNAWSPMVEAPATELNGVWGSVSSDVFVVGADANMLNAHPIVGRPGKVLHYDGSSWSEMSSGTTPRLNGVWGSSSSDVVAVGDEGTLLHYDGKAWGKTLLPTTFDIQGVWGSSSADIVAVGGGYVGNLGGIVRYDGTTWRPTVNEGISLASVGGDATDVFAVGGSGSVLHSSGAEWARMASGTVEDLSSVWLDANGQVFAVGGDVVLQYQSGKWKQTSSLALVSGCTTIDPLLPCRSSGAAGWGGFVVGDAAWGGDYKEDRHRGAAVWRSNGNLFELFEEDSATLRGIWGEGSQLFVVAGQDVRHYSGAWSIMTTGSSQALSDIWGASSTELFAVGAYGAILQFDGASWTAMTSGTSVSLSGVGGSSSTDVYAVGGSTVLHYDGIGWRTLPVDLRWLRSRKYRCPYLRAVWARSGQDVFIVGSNGTILRPCPGGKCP